MILYADILIHYSTQDNCELLGVMVYEYTKYYFKFKKQDIAFHL